MLGSKRILQTENALFMWNRYVHPSDHILLLEGMCDALPETLQETSVYKNEVAKHVALSTGSGALHEDEP